jgi:hypothetical protein
MGTNGRKPPPPRPHSSSGKGACCSYQEAGRALLRRHFRLAFRYVRIDIKTRLGVL